MFGLVSSVLVHCDPPNQFSPIPYWYRTVPEGNPYLLEEPPRLDRKRSNGNSSWTVTIQSGRCTTGKPGTRDRGTWGFTGNECSLRSSGKDFTMAALEQTTSSDWRLIGTERKVATHLWVMAADQATLDFEPQRPLLLLLQWQRQRQLRREISSRTRGIFHLEVPSFHLDPRDRTGAEARQRRLPSRRFLRLLSRR